MAELGVRHGALRHPLAPREPRAADVGTGDWADGPLERMLELGIDPIVDLVHYGAPGLDRRAASSHPTSRSAWRSTPRGVAERFRGRILWYTPLNEPRITAWYCGRLGWWPPVSRAAGAGSSRSCSALCRGIALDRRALRAVDPEIVPAHVDATDLYEHRRSRRSRAKPPTARQLVFLALDLVSGP